MFLSGDIKAKILADTTMVLLEDVVYQSGDTTFTIPAGYVSDGASVPRALSWLYPKYGEYLKAAVVHDWLITDLLPTGKISSNRVDAIFKEAMASLDIPRIRQLVMWAGVRLGAIGNKKRRKGSLKTLPKLLLVLLLTSPYTLPPSLMVQIWLGAAAFVSVFLPKQQKVTAQKS